MFTLSAFADEIDADPERQLHVLSELRIRFVEFRSILKTNVLDLTNHQLDEFRLLLQSRNFGISAIGSPIGKVRIDEPFEPHMMRFRRAIDIAKQFDTAKVRIFSYYLPINASTDEWPAYRAEILRRIGQQVEIAEKAGIRLMHENEHRIYGDSPDRVADLFDAIPSSIFAAAFDAANFVFSGYDAWEGWLKCRDRVVHLHIKDWVHGENHGRFAGEGQGRLREILTDAVARNYDGFATLEPHLLGGGPTGGVTGPELFPRAVDALRDLIREVGGRERE